MAVRRNVQFTELMEVMKMFQSLGKPYEYYRSGSSNLLKSSSMEYYCHNVPKTDKRNLPIREVNFIQKTRLHILKNELHLKIPPSYSDVSDVKFIDYNEAIPIGKKINNVYMIDIKSAYWDSALMEGFISTALWDEGNLKNKGIRLASLGSWAKVIRKWGFDGKKETFLGETKPEFPHIFFNCANRIYKCMDECKQTLGKDFLFYWTDCVYFTGSENIDTVVDLMSYFGFRCKVDKCYSGFRTHDCISIKKNKEDEESKEYPFNIRKSQQ